MSSRDVRILCPRPLCYVIRTLTFLFYNNNDPLLALGISIYKTQRHSESDASVIHFDIMMLVGREQQMHLQKTPLIWFAEMRINVEVRRCLPCTEIRRQCMRRFSVEARQFEISLVGTNLETNRFKVKFEFISRNTTRFVSVSFYVIQKFTVLCYNLFNLHNFYSKIPSVSFIFIILI